MVYERYIIRYIPSRNMKGVVNDIFNDAYSYICMYH